MIEYELTKDNALFILNRVNDFLLNLDDSTYTIRIDKKREKRSKSANSYCWVLLDKLAAKTGIKKEDIYRDLIKNIGGNALIATVGNTDVQSLIEDWQSKGLGWVAEIVEKTDTITPIFLYEGSSVYDTAQMKRLIDLVVQECQQQDIETLTPAELSLLEY